MCSVQQVLGYYELVSFDESRIRQSYSRRDSMGKPKLYTWLRPDSLYIEYRKKAMWSLAFKEANFHSLSELEILDIGCGSGSWLRMLCEWDARPARMHGIDLLEDRINSAKALSPPSMDFKVGNACELDFPDNSMDLVAASTVFSSIPDPSGRMALAKEMLRIVRPQGRIMIFDFAISDPRNRDTVGIGKNEMRRLFHDIELERTLKLIFPPPLLRLFPARLLCLAHVMETLFPLICTHRLFVFRQKQA